MKKKITFVKALDSEGLGKGAYFAAWDTSFIEALDGVAVAVWDFDTKTEHQLRFKQWSSNGSYVFNGMWNRIL
ncbi:hypothetical protein CFP56_020679 [Quercus suber]|uniref:Uncharacterized protein n=1 Tax=Quercus suber TaxID=58331 RepID=A0AAW0KEQ4_QUESU